MPLITLNTVDLPAPLGPITLTISFSLTSRSSSEIARSPPNASDSLSISSSAISDRLHAMLAEQPVRPRCHRHDQDRAEHDLRRDRRVDDQAPLPAAGGDVDRDDHGDQLFDPAQPHDRDQPDYQPQVQS